MKIDQTEMSRRLIASSEAGDLVSVKTLIDEGADVHAGDDLALRLAAFYGHTEVVNELLKPVLTYTHWMTRLCVRLPGKGLLR